MGQTSDVVGGKKLRVESDLNGKKLLRKTQTMINTRFIARNSITNYAFEAINLNAGPVAVVQNTFKDYVHNFSTCAMGCAASQTSLTGESPDDAFAFVGNTVDGGRHGFDCSHSPYSGQRTYRLNASGNTFSLQDPFNVSEDFPGATVTLAMCERTIICGNTLTAGGRGVWIDGPNVTNAIILKNDFARADFSGITDRSLGTSLLSAAVVKNVIGEGVGYHLKLLYADATHWFMLSNQFRAWTNYTTATNLVSDPATPPLHLVP